LLAREPDFPTRGQVFDGLGAIGSFIVIVFHGSGRPLQGFAFGASGFGFNSPRVNAFLMGLDLVVCNRSALPPAGIIQQPVIAVGWFPRGKGGKRGGHGCQGQDQGQGDD